MAAWDVSNIDHRRLLLSDDVGWTERVARYGLRGVSVVYGAAARWRRLQYDRGHRPTHRASVPVISVGNLTTGGTGKTPVVAEICRRLREAGHRAAIISRGYGATSGYNDEAMELMRRLPDVPIVQHSDRVAAASIAIDELEAEVLVMDDGFQHRRLDRVMDVVVIDATNPFGGGWMLPGGYLREPISSLRRADMVIVTRTDQVDDGTLSIIDRTIGLHHDSEPLRTVHHPIGVERLHSDEILPPESLEGRSVALLSAVGNPDAFERTVLDLGCRVVSRMDLPDHDAFDRTTRDRIRQWVQAMPERPSMILCTSKDFVKLQTDSINGVDVGHVQIALQFTDSDEPLSRHLADVMAQVD